MRREGVQRHREFFPCGNPHSAKITLPTIAGQQSETRGNVPVKNKARNRHMAETPVASQRGMLRRRRVCMRTKVLQLYSPLCDPMDYSPPGSSVHGIFQARILEWVNMPSSTGSSWPKDWTHISCIGRQILYHWAPPSRKQASQKLGLIDATFYI